MISCHVVTRSRVRSPSSMARHRKPWVYIRTTLEQPMLFRSFTTTMSKHPRSPSVTQASNKRSRPAHPIFSPNKIASASAAAAVDANPPLQTLLQAVREAIKSPSKGDCVVYWMRMADLRGMCLPYCSPNLLTRQHSF